MNNIEKNIIEAIKQAKKTVVAFNEEFGYKASKGEIAADIWHNHLTFEQRYHFSKNVKSKGVDAARECYSLVEVHI